MPSRPIAIHESSCVTAGAVEALCERLAQADPSSAGRREGDDERAGALEERAPREPGAAERLRARRT